MIRIVKMVFKPEMVDEFLANFKEDKAKIRNFDGVEHLELLQDKNHPNIYFTYSKWKSPNHLEKYRNSDLFKGIWAVTKPMFSEKAQAWSVDSIEKLL
ncbi:antibiotic biosynthesis monooxygenase [Vicingus serpentipes]|uniref:Antibiotic biosynthesis monooxygenase n=1 Tax=Vicingus serpentipes TaxID=1926625 RepID=A0A5C6RTL1_9FLAO|nr:antibiotic biosynthesis monooxygenase family protein [Vicingus serpentipes]TXB65806.1 antibiotic biosynthesis monooxygenase [Vicingus serpentipes]